MQEKLLNLVNIKIDAINKNIDNLNYFNSELEKNNLDLKYIEEKFNLFSDNEILNFDNITSEDFEKILTMIDPAVTEIFQDKSCNYYGIMYIIQGIRQGISLDLTIEQTGAILKFVEGMKQKIANLNDVINNLEENKEHLPETKLDLLMADLDKYRTIISKIENNLYLNEIDEIIEVFDFSDVSIEEKIGLFEYILKYNADIYNLNKDVTKEEQDVDNFSLDSVQVPEFHYEPINLVPEPTVDLDEEIKNHQLEIDNDLNNVEVEEEVVNNDFELPELDLNNLNFEAVEKVEEAILPLEEDLKDANEFENTFDNNTVEEDLENTNLNTVDLEEIIKKIDAKLKEIEEQEVKEEKTLQDEEVNIVLPDLISENQEIDDNEDDGIQEDESTTAVIDEIFLKYNINSDIVKQNITKNAFEVDELLSILENNNILNILNQKENLLNNILVHNNADMLGELLGSIRENFVLDDNNYQRVLKIMIETMPNLFVDLKVIESFFENIKFFKEHQINLINLFDNYRELLIIDNNLLIENNLRIESYGLSLNNDNVKYLLYNKYILRNLDYYVEATGREKGFLGKEEVFDGIEYITKYPYKLNGVSSDMLLKLRYSTENNLKIFGSKPGILAGEISNPKVDLLNIPEDYKNLYFEQEYGFIDRSEMEKLLDELGNMNEFDMILSDNINKLDSLYKVNNLRYKIENLLFSRIKTIRLYNFLLSKNLNEKNALIIALTYNSVIKKDEYDKIVNIITTVVEGGN